ncbi:MAG TPA: 2-dehydropantoate 2-reductase N-terminal domain-containing protein, partial [Sphingobium sp.]
MKAGVIGAGAWGTALAQTLSAQGEDVRLWALEPDVVDAVNRNYLNPLYLPG